MLITRKLVTLKVIFSQILIPLWLGLFTPIDLVPARGHGHMLMALLALLWSRNTVMIQAGRGRQEDPRKIETLNATLLEV